MIRLTLPWAVLAQVNHRLVARKDGRGLTLTGEYRRAKEAAWSQHRPAASRF